MFGPEWQPSASIPVLHARAAMLGRIRAYFAAQEVREVETPVLSAAAVSDPAIESIAAQTAQGDRLYLHTSPEYSMKRLLAAGFGDCYQVCPVFRDGESGRLHNPEFTMIEWYRLDFGVGEMEHDVDRLLRVACAELRAFPPARAVSYRAAMRESCGIDCATARVPEIRAALAARGIEPLQAAGWERDEWLDLLMGGVVGPSLGHDSPVFVHDYPPAQAALARLRKQPDGSAVAERFELYVDGVELANGFHELGDPSEQRHRFELDQATRRRRGLPLRPLDERLLAALVAGLPDCGGVALGFDRLVMAGHRLQTLGAAMAFPASRA